MHGTSGKTDKVSYGNSGIRLVVIPVLLAIAVVAFELVILAYFRWRFFEDTFIRALGIVTFAGIIIAAISAGLGSLLGSTPN